MKEDWTTNAVSLDNDNMQLMTDTSIEAMQYSFMSIGEWQEELSGTVIDVLMVLCKAVEEVNIVVDGPSTIVESQAPYKTFRMDQTVAFVPTLPIMLQVPKTVVKCGTLESNLDFQDANQLIIDFSSMHMNEVYAIHNVVNA